MTTEEFHNLDEERQHVVLFEADKVCEWSNEYTNCQLFYTPNFYIETKTSIRYRYKRLISTFTLNTLPLIYAGSVQLKLA
ncbi:hypothetical protein [Segetibacter koreensis]|uniref:hypothetical protein n=1 Tax=Segetibacter koreensis TaxID=398037 RepID=UPI001FE0B1DE|nr:hypothetical protein [Segetibacter koreensis]